MPRKPFGPFTNLMVTLYLVMFWVIHAQAQTVPIRPNTVVLSSSEYVRLHKLDSTISIMGGPVSLYNYVRKLQIRLADCDTTLNRITRVAGAGFKSVSDSLTIVRAGLAGQADTLDLLTDNITVPVGPYITDPRSERKIRRKDRVITVLATSTGLLSAFSFLLIYFR